MDLQIRTRGNIIFNFKTEDLQIDLRRSSGSTDKNLIEKSFTDGAIFNGNRRLMSKEISLAFVLNFDNDTDYRAKYNNIVNACAQAEYLEDIDTEAEIRAKVEFISHVDTPVNTIGTTSRSGVIELSFKMLTPYWEDLTEQTVNTSGTEFTQAINNSGFLDTPAKFEIAVAATCNFIQIFITDPVRGIEIQDLAFGTTTELNDYVIDNNLGTVLLGDDLIDRTSRIRGGSGFFDFPVGNFTLNFKFSVAATVAIKYRRRYYL